MWGISDATRAALLARGDLTWRVDLLIDGTVAASVPVTGGGIDVDATATNRRTLSGLAVADPEDWLPLVGGLLQPTGNELAVWAVALDAAGTMAVDADGNPDWVPCGVFGIRKPAAAAAGGITLSVDAADRSQRVADVQMGPGYTVATGTNYGDAIAALIDDGVPDLPRSFASTTASVPAPGLVFAEGDDRWQHASEMAKACGMDLYFDAAGTLVLEPVPDPAETDSSWTYAEGAGSQLTAIGQEVDAGDTFSHAVAVGQPADPTVTPIRSDAYDDNPASPTYYLGTFGDRRIRFVSAFIGTQDQADSAAAGLLRRHQGLLESLTLTGYQNVAHEGNDVVAVQSGSLGIDALYGLSKFRLTIGPGLAQLSTRARRTTTP